MKILFIVEQNLLDGKAYFGSSNDLFLIFQSIRNGHEVYLTSPQKFLEENQSQFYALKLSDNLDQIKIINEIKLAWYREVINNILALPSKASLQEKLRSKILFANAKTEKIDLNSVKIFNRSEPISLSDQLYEALIKLKENGTEVIPNPFLNQILGDKLAIYLIHYNQQITGVNLLEGIDITNKENEISFKSKIISLSQNKLNAAEISQFYSLIEKENFTEAEKLFVSEYQIFFEAINQYLAFHLELGNDSIIKPHSYFGGVGIVVWQNKTLNFKQAAKNILQSFLAIKNDCKNSGSDNLAFLPKIIVQERSTHAHLGDLRIVFCKNNLQGIFVRVNPNFSESNANNLHFGGHAESLFKHYSINKIGVDAMISDLKQEGVEMEEIKKAEAIYGLIQTIKFLQKIKIFQSYPIIGTDALLTKDKNGNYQYRINEINLTSPMGQVQLITLDLAVKFNLQIVEILKQNGLVINLKKYQILADYFSNADKKTIVSAQKILLENIQLQKLIDEEIDSLMTTIN